LNFNIFRSAVDETKYTIATYKLRSSTDLREAAWALAIGQSVGNPNVRNKWETKELFENHSCIVMHEEWVLKQKNEDEVKIAFPIANTDWVGDGISHLLCQLMGGQMDIGIITGCRLVDLQIPKHIEDSMFKGPKYGIDGFRKFTQTFDKPLLGGIVKPKIGVTPEVLLEMVKEMVEGGINFIKEDEVMANPSICPIRERVPLIMDYLKDKDVIYSVCINGDAPHALERAKLVSELGGNSVHINVWSGLGVYKSIRDLDLPLFIHFQKSGDKVFTEKLHDYGIDWKVICDLAGLMGVDSIHAGMWGGYMEEDQDLGGVIATLHNRNVVPALSCGMHPGLVNAITEQFGIDYMANVGGALHGHPGGTKSGVKAMRQSIDKTYGQEYGEAINKWGLVK